MAFPIITGHASLYVIATQTEAQNGVQADSPQNLTSAVDTTLYQTPTLSFGDIGMTGEQATSGYASNAHAVGHFENTRLLERIALIYDQTWATSDLASTPNLAVGLQKYLVDIDGALKAVARNAQVLSQFQFYRANIEITFRLNTNQFYYGALMLTLFPAGTGDRFDERSVLDPTIISASSAESVIKTWEYTWPDAWKVVSDGTKPTYFSIDVLAPLTRANENMPDAITMQMWARFTDIHLSYPTGAGSTDEVQSSNGPMPKVKFPSKSKRSHPADDPASGSSSVDAAIEAISSVTIGDAIQSVSSLSSFVTENWGSNTMALGLLFDKPDREVPQTPIISEPSIDMFNCDIPDSNVSVGTYKSRYVDPGHGRMPMSKNWTVSDYSRIPALRSAVQVFTSTSSPWTVPLIQGHEDNSTMKIPLDFSVLSAAQFRGSVKLLLQFFTSSFISARFVLQYGAYAQGIEPVWPTDYTNGISHVINVKGDTVDSITLPYLNTRWWSQGGGSAPDYIPYFRLFIDSVIATTDTVQDPTIYCLAWVAGGDDAQFAYPVPVPAAYWSNEGASVVQARKINLEQKQKEKELEGFEEMQAAPGSLFQKTFPPIGENCHYDIDRGFSTAEMLGPITDICKRYSQLTFYPTDMIVGWDWADLDRRGVTGAAYQSFRGTHFGSWRSAFLFRSGGYKYRFAGDPAVRTSWKVFVNESLSSGTRYVSPVDGMVRLTFPQLIEYPYTQLLYPSNGMLVVCTTSGAAPSDDYPEYLAARDDLQFGYPILPVGYSLTFA